VAVKKIYKEDHLWRWCPVCMSNQFFEWRAGELRCTNPRHLVYLQTRTDEWVRQLPEWKAIHPSP
jgi:hypothetical protein